jgi:hypothetical protein
VFVLRKGFDVASGYTIGKHLKSLDERDVLIRCIFLETVAGRDEPSRYMSGGDLILKAFTQAFLAFLPR